MGNTVVSSIVEIDSNLFVSTEGEGIFLSNDKGVNWEKVNSGLSNYEILSLAVIGKNLFAGTFGSGVYRTTDNGANWTVADTGSTMSGQYVPDLFVIENNLLAITWSGSSYLSTDNGDSWTKVYDDISHLGILSFVKVGSNLFAGTNYGGIYLSTNNGISWTSINDGFTEKIVQSLATDGTNLFVGGIYGSVWRRPLAEVVTSISPSLKVLPKEFDLSQNYPNPFNPATVIQYTLVCESNVTITVYDNLGQIVRTFNEGTKNAGSYKLNFDGESLSSGVYFYRLNTVSLDGSPKLSAIKKMLLLK
ncbi:MAG: T9SS type A sorting domain-containing protein [Ignavibacteriaceae bacterium]|jgi:ligand-binding sensor domain-containing protein|nr:T9SS type A sorting domain-containing protein [Ignavibacteriaceae bacterium]